MDLCVLDRMKEPIAIERRQPTGFNEEPEPLF